jgi:SAM-dependent methyltransferase
MAHQQQRDYCISVKNRHPTLFKNTSVLDVGSLDINGSNHYLFEENYDYVGIDIIEGRNVNYIGRSHTYHREEPFDVAISTECFEHDEFWKESFQNMYNLLKPAGLLMFTCASEGRNEHGTARCAPWDAPGVAQLGNYYGNLTEKMFKENFDIASMFSEYEFQEIPHIWDLYFYGIKK